MSKAVPQGTALLFGNIAKELIEAFAKCTTQRSKLNVGYKALPGFYALYRILVNIETDELKSIGKLTLRYFQRFAKCYFR